LTENESNSDSEVEPVPESVSECFGLKKIAPSPQIKTKGMKTKALLIEAKINAACDVHTFSTTEAIQKGGPALHNQLLSSHIRAPTQH